MQLDCIYFNKTKHRSFNKQSAQSVRENVFPNSKCTRRASTYNGLLLTPTKLSRVIVPVTPCYDAQKTNNKKKSNSKPAKNNSKIQNSKQTKISNKNDIDKNIKIDFANYKILI